MNEDRFTQERRQMVRHQIEARGVSDARVLKAMLSIPRHIFVPEPHRRAAYEDGPLPIGHGQTISQPFIVGLMTQMLDLRETDHVLEIGAGSGYQAAILSQIAKDVISIERLPDIAEMARKNLETLDIRNVRVVEADGTEGYAEEAPYDAIIVTAAAPDVPPPLVDQLAEEGRLVAPVGAMGIQTLVKMIKTGGRVITSQHGGVSFVPLIGRYGWPD